MSEKYAQAAGVSKATLRGLIVKAGVARAYLENPDAMRHVLDEVVKVCEVALDEIERLTAFTLTDLEPEIGHYTAVINVAECPTCGGQRCGDCTDEDGGAER